MDEEVTSFISWCRVRGVKESTLVSYKWILSQFLRYTDGDSIMDVSRYIEHISVSDRNSTIQKKKVVIKLWFKYKGKVEIYNEIKINHIDREMRISALVSDDDLKKLLCSEGKIKASAEQKLRNRAFIEFLYWTGCRLGETLKVKMTDVEQTGNGLKIYVSGKTGPREVFVFYKDIYFLDKWLRFNESKWLFPSVRIKPCQRPVSDETANYILHVLEKHVGKKLHAHLFRHSAATRMAKEGYPESFMRRFFGWSSMSKMPSYYIHLAQADIEKMMMEKNGIAVTEKEQTSVFRFV